MLRAGELIRSVLAVDLQSRWFRPVTNDLAKTGAKELGAIRPVMTVVLLR
jgi:hypothetical protein